MLWLNNDLQQIANTSIQAKQTFIFKAGTIFQSQYSISFSLISLQQHGSLPIKVQINKIDESDPQTQKIRCWWYKLKDQKINTQAWMGGKLWWLGEFDMAMADTCVNPMTIICTSEFHQEQHYSLFCSASYSLA